MISNILGSITIKTFNIIKTIINIKKNLIIYDKNNRLLIFF